MRATFFFTTLITLSAVFFPATAAGIKAKRCAIRKGSSSSSPSPSTPNSISPSSSGSSSGSGSSPQTPQSGGSSSSSSQASSGLSSKAPQTIKAAWFAGWHANSVTGTSFNVDQISWQLYNHIAYSVAVPTGPNDISTTAQDDELISQLVSAAHVNNATVSISLGGWTGSRSFSSIVSAASSRSEFVQTLATFVEKFDLDGIDFDWEYPNKQGIGCNTISPDDSSNLLALLQLLRATSSTKNLILSAAVGDTTFASSTGGPMSDVSEFAKVLDFIEMMNYDIWGSWSSAVGPNSPLDDSCAPAPDQQGSATSGVRAWTEAGMPAEQIVLGVASYGHSFSVTPQNALQDGALVPYPPFDKNNQPVGDAWDAPPGTDVCGNPTPQGGIFDYWGLIEEGFLTSAGKPAEGINYRFDSCSQTAYVYDSAKQVMVSFDDTNAFAAKGQFITKSKLKGFAMWEAGGDSSNQLLNAIVGAL